MPADTVEQIVVRTVFCAICLGEFDEAEWNAETHCPECEQAKQRLSAGAVRQRLQEMNGE